MFVPLGQRILVEDIIETYVGTLQLPPTSREKPTFTSKVIAMSDEIANPKIKIGDVIHRGEFIGQIMDVKNHLRVMNIMDVLGVDRD